MPLEEHDGVVVVVVVEVHRAGKQIKASHNLCYSSVLLYISGVPIVQVIIWILEVNIVDTEVDEVVYVEEVK